MRKKFLIPLLIFIVSSFIFAKSNKPLGKTVDWISSPYSKYPAEKYFAAVGSDKNKTEAELEAVEKLAAVFGRDVKSQKTAESSSIHHEEGDSAGSTVLDSSLNFQIQSEVDQKDLIGIEIKESIFDEKKGIWYSLALLDKEKTAGLYSKLVKDNCDSINCLIQAAQAKDVSIEKFACYYKAHKLAALNESYFPRFYIINPKMCDESKKQSPSSVQIGLKAEKVASQIPCKVAVNSEKDRVEIGNVCAEVLKSFGFSIAEKNAVYTLEVEVKNNQREVQNPKMYYSEYSLLIQLKGKDSIYAPWTKKGRAGGKNPEMAVESMKNMILKEISSEYKTILEQNLYGEN